MENLVAAPVLVTLAAALVLVPLAGRSQRLVSIAAGVLALAASVALLLSVSGGAVLVLSLGGWGPGIGIVWVADRLSAVMLVTSMVVGVTVLSCLGAGWLETRPSRFIHPLVHLQLAGVAGALLTGDLFNLFVFYEVTLLASFALIVSGEGEQMLPRTFPYVLVNLAASGVFLAALGVVYAEAGTVNLAEVATRLPSESGPFRIAIGLLLAVFAVKAGLVPFFVWLPDSYPSAPITITALFAGLLTKVGVYTLFRTTPLLFAPGDPVYLGLVWVGAATMVIGVLGALGRSTLRGILSFHIVSQVGYMVFGLGLGNAAALAAALLFTLHNMLVKPALILAGGVAERLGGTGELKRLGGLAARPWAAAAFFVPAMALAGLPPLSGFWGKFLLLRAGFAAGEWAATAVALGVSLFTLASMLKIWSAVYWSGKQAPPPKLAGHDRGLLGAALGLGVLAVAFGIAISPLLSFAGEAARGVIDPAGYVEAVRGGRR